MTTTPSEVRPPLAKRLARLAVRVALSTAIFIVTLEIGLRLIGFEHHPYIARVRDNQAKAVVAEFTPDPYSMWAPKPGSGPFNELGYIGPELPRERTPGTVRIACLGDSCTQAGSPPYPARVAERLAERGHSNVEVMNWGVAGFSSFQGLKRLEHDVLAYRPDIVTIYFGWNDHWIRAGFQDDVSAQRSLRSGPIWSAVEETRVVQATDWLLETFRGTHSSAQFRVPLPAYRENLRAMIRQSRAAGARVLLITAPGCLGNDAPIQEHIIGLSSLGYTSVAAVHADYLAATRAIASELSVELLDAAHYFAADIPGCDYFLPDRDPVHLTDAGLDVLAEQLADRLIEIGWLQQSVTR